MLRAISTIQNGYRSGASSVGKNKEDNGLYDLGLYIILIIRDSIHATIKDETGILVNREKRRVEREKGGGKRRTD
jgi:hypothetical protein